MKIRQLLRDKLAPITANWMRHFAFDPKYYELWQSHGFHVSKVDFYSPLPDTRELGEGLFVSEVPMRGIDIDMGAQCALLQSFRDLFGSEYRALEDRSPCREEPRFYFGNVSFESVDAEVLYCMVRSYKPRRVIEVGSGFSTLLTAEALAANKIEGHGAEFTAIEPYPPDFLNKPLLKQTDILNVKNICKQLSRE